MTDENLRKLVSEAPAGSDWWYDGRDIFYRPEGTNMNQLIVPFPETWHESQRVPDSVANLIVAAVNYARSL